MGEYDKKAGAMLEKKKAAEEARAKKADAELEAKRAQEEQAGVDKRKRETENATRTVKAADLMVAKLKKQYEDLKKKRDESYNQQSFMWYEDKMHSVQASIKTQMDRSKGASSMLKTLAEADKAWKGKKAIADKAAAEKAEVDWKAKAEQTKTDKAAFEKKMNDTIKRLGELKTTIADKKTSAKDKAAAEAEQKLKQKAANEFKVKYNNFKRQAEANAKVEDAKKAAAAKKIEDAKKAMVTDLAESKKNYLATQKQYNETFGKLQLAIKKKEKPEAVKALREAADKLRGEMKDKRSHWDKFADAKNAADASAAEEVEQKKRAGADEAAKQAQAKKRKAVDDAKKALTTLFDGKVKGKQRNWKEFEEALADAKKAHEANAKDAGLKKKYTDLDAIQKEYTKKKAFIVEQEGEMKKFATAEAERVKKLRAEQIKQLTAKR